MQNAQIVHRELARIGVPEDISHMVELRHAPPIEGAAGRGVVAVGYVSKERFLETAMVNAPSYDEAVELLSDAGRILPLIAMGVRAMPADVRPPLPDWIDRTADGMRRDLRRASRLAGEAARGRFVETVPSEGDGPF